MKLLSFSNDNRNPFVQDRQNEINFCFHINTFAYPLLHGHSDYWEFTIVTKGSIINEINGKSVRVDRGQVFHSSPYDNHAIYLADKTKNHIRYINLIGRDENVRNLLSLFPEKFQESIKDGTEVRNLSQEAILEIEAAVKRTMLLRNDELETYNALISSAILVLLSSVYRSGIHQDTESDFVRKLEELKNAPDFLDLSVEELGKRVGSSRAQTHRNMKKHYGMGAHEFINSHRLRNAESMLLTTDFSIEKIAKDSGFSGLPIFYSNFKKAFGTSPSLYRKEYKNK